MIKHIVLFKLKNPADAPRAVSALQTLKEKISCIRALEVGVNEVASPRACDIALTVDFDSLADLKIYASHEHHLPVVQLMGELCERVYSVDYSV